MSCASAQSFQSTSTTVPSDNNSDVIGPPGGGGDSISDVVLGGSSGAGDSISDVVLGPPGAGGGGNTRNCSPADTGVVFVVSEILYYSVCLYVTMSVCLAFT